MEGVSHVVRDVTVVGELRAALICEIDGRRIVVPRAVVRPGSAVHRRGDHGTLVVPRAVAFDLGLADANDGPQQAAE